ncbi:MAG TPA: hypothetical protein VFW33_15785, partial [Gemmataceae bacterium]|nr:hypothetical protein [Gemmataceae bacterium]
DYLQKVRQRPLMYVRDWSLEELETWCRGYAVALSNHGIEEFGTHFNEQFSDYLWKQYGWSMCRSWARGVREQSRTPEEAFHRFFELLEEFKQHLAKAGH